MAECIGILRRYRFRLRRTINFLVTYIVQRVIDRRVVSLSAGIVYLRRMEPAFAVRSIGVQKGSRNPERNWHKCRWVLTILGRIPEERP